MAAPGRRSAARPVGHGDPRRAVAGSTTRGSATAPPSDAAPPSTAPPQAPAQAGAGRAHGPSPRVGVTAGAPTGPGPEPTTKATAATKGGATGAMGPFGTPLKPRGNLAYKDGEVLAPAGSGTFVERTYETPAPGPAVR